MRKSEEDELIRLIGRELIEKCEEVRDQYDNLKDIMKDMEEPKDHISTKTKTASILADKSEFLNKEISFLIDNLRKKAVDSGLHEDHLMPLG